MAVNSMSGVGGGGGGRCENKYIVYTLFCDLVAGTLQDHTCHTLQLKSTTLGQH